MVFFKRSLILVRGGGDLASGVVYRLHRAGFPVIVTELVMPKFVRRTVCYGEAVYSGSVTIEGVTARLIPDIGDYQHILDQGEIPIICDATLETIHTLHPTVIVDARMKKHNSDTTCDDAPLVIALGPGYNAGEDCHVVIETKRGHFLGRVIGEGSAEPDTGIPGVVTGKSYDRVLRAPVDGFVEPEAAIGDVIAAGQRIGTVTGKPIIASFDGMLRGLVHSRLPVKAGMKIGDLDPRAQRAYCFTISDKSLAVGGGVLEAVFSAPHVRSHLQVMEVS